MGIAVAALVLAVQQIALRRTGEDGDRATHGAIAEYARRGAAGNHNALELLGLELSPVNPAAKRIVRRDAVPQNQRTACARRTDAAQRDTLRGRVSHQTGRAAEQAEARHRPQAVIQVVARRLANLFAIENGYGRGRFRLDVFDDRNARVDRLDFVGPVLIWWWRLRLALRRPEQDRQDEARGPESTRRLRGRSGRR